jgi:SAM-dependent methyltransferase
MADDSRASTYLLGTEERRRLELLEECLDPMTARSLDAIGIERGWRCLELGGGGGSVTRMLCERVGPGGRVTAVDLDTRFLDELTEDNLDVRCCDVVADGLPGDGYDFVHARLLLMHLANREKFVDEMVSVLRPGGWLLVEDMDVYPLETLAEGAFAEVWGAVVRAFEAAGACPTMGRQIPPLFDRAGLEAVAPVCEVPIFRGDSHWAGLITASVEQLRPVLLSRDVDEEQLTALSRSFDDPTQWFAGFAMYPVRGRMPAA